MTSSSSDLYRKRPMVEHYQLFNHVCPPSCFVEMCSSGTEGRELLMIGMKDKSSSKDFLHTLEKVLAKCGLWQTSFEDEDYKTISKRCGEVLFVKPNEGIKFKALPEEIAVGLPADIKGLLDSESRNQNRPDR